MNKAFRRSLLSLTAASAMATSSFAGDAAYLDIKVNYLNSDNTVVLGENDEDSNNDRVEILVSLLDKDGELATKTKDGKTLDKIEISRNNDALSVNDDNSSEQAGSIAQIGNTGKTDGAEHLKLYRDIKENKNINRFVLDYTNFIASKLMDELVVKGGGLKRTVMVNLSSVDANGLVVRVSKLNSMQNEDTVSPVEGLEKSDTDNYLNAAFKDISITDDNDDLSEQSGNFPSGVAGVTVPLRIYASTQDPEKDANVTIGKFTLAPNLEGKTIVVTAVADYDVDGKASTVLNSVELVMKNGMASGEIKINQGLPGKNINTVTANEGVVVNTNFGTSFQGLGVAFVAYVKDDTGIANIKDIDTDKLDTFSVDANNSSTDTLVIRSGDAAGLKVGKIKATKNNLADIWGDTSTKLYMNDVLGNSEFDTSISGASDVNITLTVVDALDNPAILSQEALYKKMQFDGYDDENTSDRFSIVSVGTIAGNVLSTSTVAITLDYNGSGTTEIATTIQVNIQDNDDKNGSATEELSISYANGGLAGMDTVKVDIINIEPLRNKIGGSPVLKELFETNTTTAYTTPYSVVDKGVVPVTNPDTKVESPLFMQFKAKVKLVAVGDNNETVKFSLSIEDPEKKGSYITSKFKLSGDIESPTTGAVTIKDDAYEFNLTTAGSTKRAVEINASNGQPLGAISFDGNFSGKGIEKLAGESVTIEFKAYANQMAPYYVDVLANVEDSPTKKENFYTGDTLTFKFSGEASEGDTVEIEFNTTTTGDQFETRVGLADDEYDADADGKIKATLGADKTVTVRLYDVNGTDNKVASENSRGMYSVETITLNNSPVIYKTYEDDGDTKATYELKSSELFSTGIYVTPVESDKAAKIKFNLKKAISVSQGTGEGDKDDQQAPLPNDVIAELVDADGYDAIELEEEVKTDIFYSFFADAGIANTTMSVRDAYKNFVNTGENTVEDNFEVECTSGMECEFKGGKDGFIKFKPEAAGTTQTITFKVKDKPEITNTISFTKIAKSVQNTKFNMTQDIGHATFNVVHSEVVIKVQGDGQKTQEDVTFTATSDNKDAKVKMTPIAVSSNFFKNMLDGDSVEGISVNKDGSYYIVTSDKPGKVTVTAKGTISKDDSDTKEEVVLNGSRVVNFVAVDLDRPSVPSSSVVAVPSGIKITIVDANLDVDKTSIIIKGIDNNFKGVAKYEGNGVYVANDLSKGTYTIEIDAIDLAGNTTWDKVSDSSRVTYSRIVTQGDEELGQEEEVAKALDTKSFDIAGTFSAVKGDDAQFNWVYMDKATSTTFKLQGDKTKDADMNPFGFGATDMKADDSAEKWYMVKLTDANGAAAAGKFGWAMVKSDMSVVKKISSVKADGSFDYLAISITATMTDGKISFSK